MRSITSAFQPRTANYAEKTSFLTEKLITRKELLAELGIAYRTFSRLRVKGDGPAAVWVGGRQMFTASGVRDWLARNTERPGRPYKIQG